MVNAAHDLGVPRDSVWAAALACMQVFRTEGRSYVPNWVALLRPAAAEKMAGNLGCE